MRADKGVDKMKGFRFWQRWLFVVGVVVALFGGVMALLNSTVLFEMFNDQIDPVFWGAESIPGVAQGFRGWVYGAWGATVAGWGIFIIYIAHYPFRKRELCVVGVELSSGGIGDMVCARYGHLFVLQGVFQRGVQYASVDFDDIATGCYPKSVPSE